MLPTILYELTLFSPGDDREEAEVDLTWFLEALTQRDQDYLRQRPETPLLYKSGVVYERPAQFGGECEETSVLRRELGLRAHKPGVAKVLKKVQEVFGGERFRDVGVLVGRGKGDCDNIASWRAAELRQAGVKANPRIKGRKRPGGGTTYHVDVMWPDDSSEDPCLLLGMGGADRAEDRVKERESAFGDDVDVDRLLRGVLS